MKKFFTALTVCAALSFVGCIDREFDLAETSGEVTIGGEELVLPLGSLEKITLEDIIGEMKYLKSEEDGLYQINYTSYGDNPEKYETLSIEGLSIPTITGLSPKLDPIQFSFQQLPTKLTMRGFSEKFEVDFPTINKLMNVKPINVEQEISVNLPSSISGQGTLPDLIASQLPHLAASTTEEIVFEAKISLLEELKKIDFVEFGCEEHPLGAPFEIVVDLNGLHNINGGGSVNFNMEFPKGYYLRDELGNDLPTATHNILTKEIAIAKNQDKATLLFYLHKIDYSDHTFVDGYLHTEDHISYSYNIDIALCGGDYNLNAKPKFTLQAAPEYKDIEVVINHFDLPNVEYDINYSVEGIPSGISVDKVAFVNSPLTLSMSGLEWIEVLCRDTDQIFSPSLEITLPKCMQFEPHRLLDSSTNKLLATTKELAAGIQLKLAYIDCKAEGITIENGAIHINGKLIANVHLEGLDNHTILVSSIIPPTTPLFVTVAIDELSLEVDKANTVVTWSEDQIFDLNLGEQIPSISQSIEVPEMIASIERIEIGKANSKDEPLSMSFRLDAGNTFPVEELDIELNINLGKMLHPTKATLDSGIIKQNNAGDYILTLNESWRPHEKALEKRIEFDALENIPAIKDGKIAINQSFPVSGSVKIKSGENIDLSKADGTKIDIDINIDDIEVRTFEGGVNFSVKPEIMAIDLSKVGKLGIDVKALSLNPVLKIKLKDNPTGVAFNADVAVHTYDAQSNKLATITAPTIPIAAHGAANIIISTPRNAAKYATEDVTFIAIDNLPDLLSNGIPAKIAVDMDVASDKSKIYEIDLLEAKNGFNFEYQYEVLLPFEFDGNIDVMYESSISDLNETFATLGDETNGLKVGDIGLIAEIGTTIPFNVVISAEFINQEGTTEGIDARININKGIVEGYNPERDGEKRISTLDLGLDLGESQSLAALKNVDGVRLKVTIYNTDAEITELMKSQFLEATLKLRVRDGLTVDVFELLNGNIEE